MEAAGGGVLGGLSVLAHCMHRGNAGSNIFLRLPLEKFVPFSDIMRHSQIVSRSEDGSIGAPL